MHKPLTLLQRLAARAEASDCYCQTDDADLLNEAIAEIENLKAALEPFSDASENLDPDHRDGSPIWESPAAMGIDAKHLRAARYALKGDAA